MAIYRIPPPRFVGGRQPNAPATHPLPGGGSVIHGLALNVSSAQASSRVINVRKLVLLSPTADPFSTGFSTDFGGGGGGTTQATALTEAFHSGSSSHPLSLSATGAEVAGLRRAVGVIRGLVDAQAAGFVRIASYLRALSATNSEASSLLHPGSLFRSFASTNVQAAARRLLVSITRGYADPEAAAMIRLVTAFRILSVASAQVGSLIKLVAILRPIAEAQAAARALSVAISRGAAEAHAVSRAGVIGLARIASNGQAVSRILQALVFRSAADAQHASSAPSGQHAALLGAGSLRVVGLRKLVSGLRGAVSTQVVARKLAVSIARAATDAQVAAVRLGNSLTRLAVDAQAAARTLLVSVARSAVDLEATSSAAGAVRPRILSAIDAQIAALATAFLHAGVNTGQVLAALQAQSARLVKAAGLQRGASSSGTTVMARLVSAFRILSVTSSEMPALQRLTSTLRKAADAQATARRMLVSAIRSAVSPESTVRILTLSVFRSAVNQQVSSLKKTGSVIRALADSQVALLIKTVSAMRFGINAEVANIVTEALGFIFPQTANAINAQVAALRNRVGMLRSVIGGQALNVVRLVNVIRAIVSTEVVARTLTVFKRLATASGEAALGIALRAFLKASGAVSSQAVALFRVGLHPFAGAVAAANSARVVKLVSTHRSAANAIAAFRGAFTVGLHLLADPLEATGVSVAVNRGRALVVRQAQAVLAAAAFNHFGMFSAVVSTVSKGTVALTKTVAKAFGISKPSITTSTLWYFKFIPLALRGRVVRLPEPQQLVALPPAARRIVLPEAQLMVMLPPAVRRVVVPIEGDDYMSDFEIRFPEPAFFSPLDPTDIDLFTFDWSVRGFPGDTIVFASIVSIPSGVNFLGPAFISGQSVTITIGPFGPTIPPLPMTYSLRCMAVFGSGRISNYSVPFIVENL